MTAGPSVSRRIFATGAAASFAGAWLAGSSAHARPTCSSPIFSGAQSAMPAGASGMALVAMEGGQAILTRCAGLASRAFSVPVTERTLFQLGSVSKHVTAVAVLRLAEQGVLRLDDPVGRYISGFPEDWGRATILQLLTHSGGLPANFESQPPDRPFTRDVAMAFARELPALAAPGTTWLYSNIGYVLLGFLIENISGHSYGDHIGQLFRDHGLTDSRVDAGGEFIPDRAEPALFRDGRFHRAPQMSNDVSGVAAGGLLMSARDVARWEQALRGDDLLSARSKQIMHTDAHLDTGRSTGYGTGWRIESAGPGKPFYMHTGNVPGFRAFYFRSAVHDRACMMLLAGEAKMVPVGMAAVEQIWCGETPLSLPPIRDRSPALTDALKSLLQGQSDLTGILAPELARLPLAVARQELFRITPADMAALDGFTLVEDVETRLERRRRYVVKLGERVLPLLVGYTPEGRIFRVTL